MQRLYLETITFSGKDVPLSAVFAEIEKQSNYLVFYNQSVLKAAKPVTISAKDMSVKDFIKAVLVDQQLEFLFKEKYIIIKSAQGRGFNSGKTLSILAETPPITGVVRGPDGQPIAGVNVVVKGTKKGVVTDAYGRFTIEVEQGKTLVISNIGYNTREIKINGDNNIIVGLEISASQLDEVQYIAYGKSSQRFQTGNVASVKAKEFEKQPVNNPLLALQGRVPGLFITQTSGLPGAGIKVRIQGQK